MSWNHNDDEDDPFASYANRDGGDDERGGGYEDGSGREALVVLIDASALMRARPAGFSEGSGSGANGAGTADPADSDPADHDAPFVKSLAAVRRLVMHRCRNASRDLMAVTAYNATGTRCAAGLDGIAELFPLAEVSFFFFVLP
jgi:hypothetical protein